MKKCSSMSYKISIFGIDSYAVQTRKMCYRKIILSRIKVKDIEVLSFTEKTIFPFPFTLNGI